jgi:hypothetical protein
MCGLFRGSRHGQVVAPNESRPMRATFSAPRCFSEWTRSLSWLIFRGLNPTLDPQAAALSFEGRAVPDYGAPSRSPFDRL